MIAIDSAIRLVPFVLVSMLGVGGLTYLTFRNFFAGALIGFFVFPFLLLPLFDHLGIRLRY